MTTPLPISLFQFLFLIAAICFSICDANSNVLCIESGDCCEWIGVICQNSTGHVNQLHLTSSLSEPDFFAPYVEWEAYYNSMLGGNINPSLLELKHLSSLDLSNNNFSNIHIPKFLGVLGSLTHLNLSQAGFQGAIPQNLGNLSKLQYLDLRGDTMYRWDIKVKSLQWVSGLSSLQYLDLSGADLSKATDWLQVTFKHPSLLELHLSNCGLEDDPSPISVNSTKSLVILDLSLNRFSSVPKSIFSLHGLMSIDISENSLEGSIPDFFGNISFLQVLDLRSNSLNSSIPNSMYSLYHLQFLSLGDNQLQGTISSAIGNFSSVTHLDLSHNDMLEGRLPTSLEYLCKLKEMDLSYNKIEGGISEILQSLSRCRSGSLESLDMADNQLSGHLTDQLGQFKNLSYLSLAQNKISGPIPSSIGELWSLKFFDVSKNQLNGQIPLSIGELSSLKFFDVSENQLNGTFPLCFGQLESLETLDFGCNLLEGVFPHWLKFQKNLSSLDISHVGISDVMPTWFLNLPTLFEYLNLSSNQLTGEISYLNVGDIVDLSSNSFTGPLPRVLSRSLHQLICNPSLTGMITLYIETNLLNGEIPDCWNHWDVLAYLNLGNNNLTGKIPLTLGQKNPSTLNLRNNRMFGELPSTMQNSTNLIMLDLSENHFNGSVPAWIGDKLSNFVVLSLRSNNFDGVIPKCFNNLSAMATTNKTKNERSTLYFINYPFYLSALLVLKGREDEYGHTLGLVTNLDLSVNSFTGEIPKEIGSLVGLLSLNFSGNHLTGNIPDNIGNMKFLESLDLAMNRLNGEIPPSFSKLNFLNHFNGNHLCGPPLTKNCTTKGIPTDVANNGSSSEGSKVNWLYVSIVLGFVMGFWGVVAPLFFIRSWRHAYYRKLDNVYGKLYVFWATMGL
ncbi:hypothetical protein ES332_D11G365300v1 [Gossypium tomentosum]|uniref:Leucine-rich repeat-containing N-terminal plant-type domain-containing protein n=1 Tax=Gossypium tomentosum TaxID=34277 RepID=A0A5D2IVW1_GOSTO|nr:hypothetical protein ES332_D11G365300v1 [Gossypium tomentosum]